VELTDVTAAFARGRAGIVAMRQVVTVLLACFLIAGLSPWQGRSQTASGPEARNPAAAAQNQATERLTVAAIGDSLGDGLWEGLYRVVRNNKRIVVFQGS
jgi:hypothetical protein